MSEQQPQPNVYLSGDEARTLMSLLMTTPVLQLYNKLNIINTVQPAQPISVETPKNEE